MFPEQTSSLTIINIALCTSGKVYSGGERALVEFIRCFEKMGFSQEVFVSHFEQGTELLNSEKTKVKYALEGIDYAETKATALIKYLRTFFTALKYLKKYNVKIVILSHSEMWPDVTFAFLLKLINSESKWFAFVHALVPVKKYDPSSLVLRFYNLLNQAWFLLLQLYSDVLFTVNLDYKTYLEKFNKNVSVIKLGKEPVLNPTNPYEKRDIDICFIGRFFIYKGFMEIPEIIGNLLSSMEKNGVQHKLNILIAGRENESAQKLKDELDKYATNINYKFTGFLENQEKHEILCRSKVLLFPSFRESFGLVYLDAISEGVPVVEYDLSDFKLHKKGVIKTPYKDNKLFAENLYRVIFNQNVFQELSEEGRTYSGEFDWWNTAQEISRNF